MPLPPIRLQPIFRPTIWGGEFLRPWLTGEPSSELIGEAWLLCDLDGTCSRIAHPDPGRSLRDFLLRFPQFAGMSGQKGCGRFPLLLKFLDTKLDLSVQVHPNDEQARRLRPGSFGKTEAWVIVHAEPGSRIYAGLRHGVNSADLRPAIARGRVAEVLHAFEAKPGQCVFIPAGTVHAVGAGIRLFEIQQSSDVTFRLYDWDRLDAKTGKPRELHLEESFACIDFHRGPVVPNDEVFVECPYFRLRRRVGRFQDCCGDTCRTLVGFEPQSSDRNIIGELQIGDDTHIEIRNGDTWLLPAELPYSCVVHDTATLLECEPRFGP